MDVNLEFDGLDNFSTELETEFSEWEDGGGYQVVNPTSYGPVINFGRGPVTPTSAEALRFESGGEVVFTQRSGPVAPQPMVRPAVDASKRQVGAIARSAASLDEFLLRMALAIEGEAKQRTPVDTGNLRAAWTTRPI